MKAWADAYRAFLCPCTACLCPQEPRPLTTSRCQFYSGESGHFYDVHHTEVRPDLSSATQPLPVCRSATGSWLVWAVTPDAWPWAWAAGLPSHMAAPPHPTKRYPWLNRQQQLPPTSAPPRPSELPWTLQRGVCVCGLLADAAGQASHLDQETLLEQAGAWDKEGH